MAKSPYETYAHWEERTFCDNASRRGSGVGIRQCVSGKREFECIVTYNEVESDTMALCSECRAELRRDARKHGYQFQSRIVEEG